MNIEIANRLVELRKKYGYSQEELADKLGLSRQAVSKWERAEASPDTDNLICLAKLYGVSLDKLLDTDESVEEIAKEMKEKETAEEANPDDSVHKETKSENAEDESKGKDYTSKEGDHIHIEPGKIHIESKDGDTVDLGGGIHINGKSGNIHIGDKGIVVTGKDGKRKFRMSKWAKIEGVLFSSILFLCIAAYMVMGFLMTPANGFANPSGWAIGWTVFFIPFVITSFVGAIYTRKFSKFNVVMLCVGLFLFLSMLTGLWHILWVILLFIPVYYPITHIIDDVLHQSDIGIKIKDTVDCKVVDEDDDDEDEEDIDDDEN